MTSTASASFIISPIKIGEELEVDQQDCSTITSSIDSEFFEINQSFSDKQRSLENSESKDSHPSLASDEDQWKFDLNKPTNKKRRETVSFCNLTPMKSASVNGKIPK